MASLYAADFPVQLFALDGKRHMRSNQRADRIIAPANSEIGEKFGDAGFIGAIWILIEIAHRKTIEG